MYSKYCLLFHAEQPTNIYNVFLIIFMMLVAILVSDHKLCSLVRSAKEKASEKTAI